MTQTPSCSPAATGLPVAVPSTALDADGRSRDDYDWVPVRRVPRNDGWSHERQRSFIEALADCGSVLEAARQVGMSASGAYRLRRSPGGEAFAAAWDAAIHQAALHLVDVAFDRAIHGSDEPVFDKEGRRIGRRMRQNDRLLMFLLRAHLPDRYAHAHRGERPEALTVPPVTPVAQALTALAPPMPDAPEALMAPDALARALDLADLYPDRAPPSVANRDGRADSDETAGMQSLGPDFEQKLEAAKRDAAFAPVTMPWAEDDGGLEDGGGENGALA